MVKDSAQFRQRFNRWKNGAKVYDAGKPIPEYDSGTDDKTYLPEYEYEATVTPQDVSLEKHKLIANEKDWQKYWGDVGAGYVNKAQESVAKPILDGLKTASYFTPLGNATAVGDFIAANINGGKDEILEAGAGLLPTVRWAKSSSKLLKDLINSPREVLSARRSGNYPLTFRERRDYITRQQRELDEAWDAVQQMQNDLASEHPGLFLPGRRIKRPKTIVGGDDVVKRMDFTDNTIGVFDSDRSIVALRRRMPGSLLPIKYKYGFKGNTAHEYQHAVRDYDQFITSEPFTIPTDDYYSLNPNSPVAPLFQDVVGQTGFNGKNRTPWQMSPDELLSEYWSYRAASDPSGKIVPKFSESTSSQKKEAVDYLSRRFNLSPETVHNTLNKISFFGGYDKGKPIKPIKCK